MKILIIEDQFSLADAMKAALEREGYTADIVTDGLEGENEALTNVYDLIILDVMLPGKDGFEILASVKNEIDAPIIMVTAKSDISDKLNGLVNGADDYITKPFHIKELLARVNNVLRRTKKIPQIDMPSFGDLTLDIKNSMMICNDNSLSVTGKEFRLMECLIIQKGNVANREQLAVKIWGYDNEAEYNNVEVYVSFLRKKLRLLKSSVKITSVRGVGYKLEAENA